MYRDKFSVAVAGPVKMLWWLMFALCLSGAAVTAWFQTEGVFDLWYWWTMLVLGLPMALFIATTFALGAFFRYMDVWTDEIRVLNNLKAHYDTMARDTPVRTRYQSSTGDNSDDQQPRRDRTTASTRPGIERSQPVFLQQRPRV